MSKKYRRSDILNRLVELITQFSSSRQNMTDDEIGNLRASLASGSYVFAEQIVQTAYLHVLNAVIKFERVEAEVFKEELHKAKAEGFSTSQAIDVARKMSKANETYLAAFGDMNEAKTELNIHNTLLSQINQVLNSMSKRA